MKKKLFFPTVCVNDKVSIDSEKKTKTINRLALGLLDIQCRFTLQWVRKCNLIYFSK